MQSRPRLAAAFAAGALALALTGCGSDSGSDDDPGSGGKVTASPLASDSASPSAAASPTASAAKVIDVTITHDSVTPHGKKVAVKRNQEVVLQLDAAAAGELHVHSSPEQVIEYPAGTSRVVLKIDQPGVVDVEDHHLDALIVQLQVR